MALPIGVLVVFLVLAVIVALPIWLIGEDDVESEVEGQADYGSFHGDNGGEF